jgi:hypothetical protein
MIKELKDKLKELESKVRSQTVEKDMIEPAFNIEKRDGVYYLIKLKYDPATKQAKVISELTLGKDYAIMLYKAKQYLVESIILRSK